MNSPVPYRLKVAASVTRYQSCTVDPRPGRAVHCPDLNACLVNEGRPISVDCKAVHFGYAIPVTVVPLEEKPELAQLVLDPTPDLTPEAVSYLLRHHPQFRNSDKIQQTINGGTVTIVSNDMAATAKHEPHRGRGKFTSEPEEDIAAIAKQISDHAEAIYQTWKSRGLAPTEILTCHSNATAADKFGTALTPAQQASSSSPVKTQQHTPRQTKKSPSPVVDLLTSTPSLDANNLEQLVNNFVSEDKARLAAARQQAKPLPSSIQFALQKFEKQSPTATNTYTKQPPSVVTPESPKSQASPSNVGSLSPHHSRTPSIPSPVTPSIQLDTVETTFPADVNITSNKQVKKVTELSDNNSTSGLATWPLKNKTIVTDKRSSPKTNDVVKHTAETSSKYATLPINNNNNNNNNKNTAYLDEVAREEERLINALKTGIIIAEEPSGTKAAVSPSEKKTNILMKKTNKEKTGATTKKEKKPVQEVVTATSKSSPVTGVKNNVSEDLSNLSLVDYAKIRYRNAQQNPVTQQRLEDVKQLRVNSGQQEVVSVTRNRFQLSPRTEEAKRAPHPELTSQQRQHIRAAAAAAAANSQPATGNNPVRPFLTRGSVAERVLIFEKCPTELMLDKRPGRGTPAINSWRSGHEVHGRAQTYGRSKENVRPSTLPPNTTLQRHVKANRNVHIPRFFYPKGKPSSEQQQDSILQKIAAAFRQFPNQQVPRDQFHTITKACDCPLYWKVPLFIAAGGEKLGYMEANSFMDFWKEMGANCHDQAALFVYILSKGQMRDLTTDDFIPFVQDVVDTHPGLTFLKEATEFHSRYVHTVITRIFYCVNRSWSGRISLPELRRSDLLRVVRLLEEEEDINQVTSYFSYEHFYVIYCKFWELDRDHDLYIDRQDLARHSDHALSSRMINRIFSGAVTRGGRQKEDKMSYTEFVWFLLSEEDKTHPTAIEYWFRCMDLDGDGYLSMYELEYFYEEQLQRMEAIGIETLPYEDCLCQMLDMIHPAEPGKVSLADLKRCKMTSIFFDTFFNLEKYLDHEQRDPFASQRDHDNDGHELSDWDRFAAEEYELLVAEEGGNDQQDEQMLDNGSGEDVLSPNLDKLLAASKVMGNGVDLDLEDWQKPSLRVSDFDQEDTDTDNSADYAADSDECPV